MTSQGQRANVGVKLLLSQGHYRQHQALQALGQAQRPADGAICSRESRNIHPPVGKRHARRSAAQRTALSIPPARRTAHVAAYNSNRSITAVDARSSASSGRHLDSLISSRCSSSISPVMCSKCPRTTAAHATLRCAANFPLALLLMPIAHHHRAAVSAISPRLTGCKQHYLLKRRTALPQPPAIKEAAARLSHWQSGHRHHRKLRISSSARGHTPFVKCASNTLSAVSATCSTIALRLRRTLEIAHCCIEPLNPHPQQVDTVRHRYQLRHGGAPLIAASAQAFSTMAHCNCNAAQAPRCQLRH